MLAKSAWVGYFGVLGISPSVVDAGWLLSVVGWFEIGLGVVAFVAPIPAVLLVVVIWKISTELLRPLAGEPSWEFVERAANMLAPLALLYVRGGPPHRPRASHGSGEGEAPAEDLEMGCDILGRDRGVIAGHFIDFAFETEFALVACAD